MKKCFWVTLLALTVSAPPFANTGGFTGQTASSGGFSGPTQGINSVQQVLDSGIFSDDTSVILTGHIQAALGKEKYLFSDNTGTITVDIDKDKWLGQTVTPDTKVQLFGEIDRDISKVKIDVDAIKVL